MHFFRVIYTGGDENENAIIREVIGLETGLKGKNVLVTGSTLGIGNAIAQAFLEEGANVIINGRSKEHVDQVVQFMQARYPHSEVRGVAADLSTLEGANRLYDEAVNGGKLDVLVNNVGIYGVVPFTEITDEDWFHIFNVNVMSIVRMSRRALPDMLAANSGKIINIGSEAGIRVNSDMAHYSTTKSACLGLTKALAELTKGTRVTVNRILPAATMTAGVLEYLETIAKRDGITMEEAQINYYKHGTDSGSLLQRFLTVEEVAMTVISTAANSGINGNNILIDAGVIKHI